MTEVDMAALIDGQGLWLLFLLTVVEGPVATIAAAAMAARGLLDLPMVFVVAVAGDLAGDVALYAIGRLSPGFARRFAGQKVDQVLDRTSGLHELMHLRPWQILVLGKLTHVLGFAVILAAGMVRVPLGLFLLASVLGTLPKVGALVLAGVCFGRALDLPWLAGVGAVAILFGGVHILHRQRSG